MKKLLGISFLVIISNPLHAEVGHIADDVYVFTHGGPSNEYRINGRVNSGEAITILERNSNTKYVHVRTEAGRTGWLPSEFVETGLSILHRLPQMETDLKASQALVETQAHEIASLQEQLEQFTSESQQYEMGVQQLQAQIRSLENDIEHMDQSNLIRWLTHGGLVALGGVILGLIIPHLPKRRKRREEWF
ncbi:TIGR04211 family SH3 domain-containing protein [Nitrincola sp. MINF-07-Sa-05]|uniref:TIGR04211 family SH3 domain-containing protein n=1 Tax=Nitrincola salilacus TaxID=3400273 RepID=UPI003918250C